MDLSSAHVLGVSYPHVNNQRFVVHLVSHILGRRGIIVGGMVCSPIPLVLEFGLSDDISGGLVPSGGYWNTVRQKVCVGGLEMRVGDELLRRLDNGITSPSVGVKTLRHSVRPHNTRDVSDPIHPSDEFLEGFVVSEC